MRRQRKVYRILIVDDSEDDCFFIRRVVARFDVFEIVAEVRDGQAAIDYLSGREKFAQREVYPMPDLVLLDLKMPIKDGYEVLAWLRTQASFPRLTVVVLSGSALQTDVGASLALGAHGYWSKSASPERQILIASEIEELLDRRNGAIAAQSRLPSPGLALSPG